MEENNRLKRAKYLVLLLIMCIMLAACGDSSSGGLTGTGSGSSAGTSSDSGTSSESKGSRDNTPKVLVPEATGSEAYSCDVATIDASNSAQGYVMAKYTGSNSKVRMLIETPAGNTYNYLMDTDGEYDAFPLSEGSGTYKIGIYENIQGTEYSVAMTENISASLKDSTCTFLYPNYYVNFNSSTEAVAKGQELAASADTDLDVVDSVFHYVVSNITYDHDKAATVQDGYVPVVDETLSTKKGICFDYAALMGTMLRSQGIPTRLEIGYAGTEYHAWIAVYTEETGWIDDYIQFDGKDWILMDPTNASVASTSKMKEMWESDSYYQLEYKY